MLTEMLIKDYPEIERISGPEDVLAYCRDLKGLGKEAFLALFLNSNNSVIAREIVSLGTLTCQLCIRGNCFARRL